MQIKEIHLVLHVLITWFIQESVGKHLLVAYWGQNSSGGKFPDNPEKDLADVCKERKYDIIVIGFVVTFFGKKNKDEMPEVNFSRHCWDAVSPEYPNLYKCPTIEAGITACQAAGKKVLISLGGATGNNDLTDAQAEVFAKNLWDLFLGGTGKEAIRPFGSAILDGVDLDIEDHKSGGYAQLVTSLRQLESGAKRSGKQMLITGAPQCPFPDASLGPSPGTALGDKGGEFDHVYVQFYNNFCHTGDPAQFYPNMDKWLQFAANAKQSRDFLMVLKSRKRSMGKGPKIFVGLPAATGGAGDPKYYRTPEEVKAIYEKLKNKPDFGGFMLWDAAWDQQNVVSRRSGGSKVYSDQIADIMGSSGEAATTASPTAPGSTTPGGPTSPTTPGGPTTPGSTTPGGLPSPTTPGSTPPGESTSPTTPGLTTPGGTTQPPTSPGPTTPPSPGGGGGKDFCKGKDDGDYPDPDNKSGYISCSGGITYKRDCPGGLLWNEEKKYCDWPSNVQSDHLKKLRGQVRLKNQGRHGYHGKVELVL